MKSGTRRYSLYRMAGRPHAFLNLSNDLESRVHALATSFILLCLLTFTHSPLSLSTLLNLCIVYCSYCTLVKFQVFVYFKSTTIEQYHHHKRSLFQPTEFPIDFIHENNALSMNSLMTYFGAP